MAAKQNQLHIFFFPFMAPGHMLPAMDMARLFATRGIRSTIITTIGNTNFFAETIEIDSRKPGIEIDILTMEFPFKEAGLPEGLENADALKSPEMLQNFFKALELFQTPFEDLIEKYQPNCLVADFFIHWANSSAVKFGIPCLTFHGMSYFSQCIVHNLLVHQPYKNLSWDSESFVVADDFPHVIELKKSELNPYDINEGPEFFLELMSKVRQVMKESYGVIMNSFYELESDYADYYKNVVGMKHWHVGPFSLCFDQGENGKRSSRRGKEPLIAASECKRWLDDKEANSVIYICLGSMSNVSIAQLREIAIALSCLGQNFILVVRNTVADEWVPQGFEEKIKGRGLIIRGWAPQTVILNHGSLGGFVTHCGWNSVIEAVVAGVPMVTWPMHAEQFYNKKLVTDVLKIGVKVGAKKWIPRVGDHDIIVSNKDILEAVSKVLTGEEAQNMRKRAKECKTMARNAVSQGGSSWSNLSALIEELKACDQQQ